MGGSGEASGEILGELGGSGVSPGGVCSQCFRQGGFRRVLESDLGGFWYHFGMVWDPFWEVWGRIFSFFGVIWEAEAQRGS